MKVLIDNGHGLETPGKRSLDGTFREAVWAREFARLLEKKLIAEGFTAERITPEDCDVSLDERILRVNKMCDENPDEDFLLLSIHCNAAQVGYGNWMAARGFNSFVSINSSAKSRRFASVLQANMWNAGYKGNRARNERGFCVQNLAICRDTKCPAVLAECLYMTNDADLALLRDAKHVNNMAEIFVKSIKYYRNEIL